MTSRSLDKLLKVIQKTKTCDIDTKREMMHCACDSIEDKAFPDITIWIGDADNEVKLVLESKYYLQYHEGGGNCRMLVRSEQKTEPNFTNVMIMGEPFLKAFYSVYNIAEEKFGMIRIAPESRKRYTVADSAKHNTRCTEDEANDWKFKGRI